MQRCTQRANKTDWFRLVRPAPLYFQFKPRAIIPLWLLSKLRHKGEKQQQVKLAKKQLCTCSTLLFLISKKATLHVQHAFFVYFFAVVLHYNNAKLPETFLWRKCRTCSRFFSSPLFFMSRSRSLPPFFSLSFAGLPPTLSFSLSFSCTIFQICGHYN